MYSVSTNANVLEKCQNTEYDFLFKIVMIGDSGVGKSCILLRFADDLFKETYLSTIGVDFRFKTIICDSKTIKLQLWDTAGQEKFNCITNAYYKGAHGIIIVFDMTNRSSFNNLEYWLDEIKDYADGEPEIMILGNKSDLHNLKEIDSEEAKKVSLLYDLTFFEVSAKDNKNILQAFLCFSEKLCQKKAKERSVRNESSVNTLNDLNKNPLEFSPTLLSTKKNNTPDQEPCCF